jgi:hypothetical protein
MIRRQFVEHRSPGKIKRRPLPIKRRPLVINPKSPLFYHPEWSGVFEKYSRSFVYKHYWRVRHVVDSNEDALQECAIVFSKCKHKYEFVVNNPRSFMKIYQTALNNYWNTMSVKDAQQRDVIEEVSTEAEVCRTIEECIHNNYSHDVECRVALNELSEEAKAVLSAIMDAPQHVIRFIFGRRPQKSSVYNQRIIQMLGLKCSHDVYTEIRNLLGKRPIG